MSLEDDLTRYFATAPQDGCGMQVLVAMKLAGELPPEKTAEVEAHLASCAECQADLKDLEATKDVPAATARVIPFPSRIRIFVAAAAAAVIAALGWSFTREDHGLTAKGAGWRLEVAAERDGKQFLAPSGTALQAGDSLGFFYSSDRAGYLTVLYADGHNAPVRLFPARDPNAAHVVAGTKVSIPDGAVLSAGADCEWIIGLFSDRSLAADEANRLAERMVAGRKGCDLAAAAEAGVEPQVVTVKR